MLSLDVVKLVVKSLLLRLPKTAAPGATPDTVPNCNSRGLLTKAAAIPKTAALAKGMRKLLAKRAFCDISGWDLCAAGSCTSE